MRNLIELRDINDYMLEDDYYGLTNVIDLCPDVKIKTFGLIVDPYNILSGYMFESSIGRFKFINEVFGDIKKRLEDKHNIYVNLTDEEIMSAKEEDRINFNFKSCENYSTTLERYNILKSFVDDYNKEFHKLTELFKLDINDSFKFNKSISRINREKFTEEFIKFLNDKNHNIVVESHWIDPDNFDRLYDIELREMKDFNKELSEFSGGYKFEIIKEMMIEELKSHSSNKLGKRIVHIYKYIGG